MGLDVIDSGNKTRLDLWPSSDLVADCVWLAGWLPREGTGNSKRAIKVAQYFILLHETERFHFSIRCNANFPHIRPNSFPVSE